MGSATTTGHHRLIVGLISYSLLYIIFAISTTMATYEAGTPSLVPPAMTLAVGSQLVETATRASAATAQALLFIPGLSGLTASVIAVSTSVVLTLIRYIDQNP